METFADLGVPSDLVAVLRDRGVEAPFPIQALTIPDGLAGRDLCGRAPTGSGKTLAFGIPMASRLGRARPHHPTGLVLVPTRELAAQVSGELHWLGRNRGLRVTTAYGGTGYAQQCKALRRGVDVLVACPGRLTDLMERGEVGLGAIEMVVLDEADRMADMGFLPAVRKLLDQTPPTRQTLLFSATLDGAVDPLVRHYQQAPVRHALPEDDGARTVHRFWRVVSEDRVRLAADLIRNAGPTIVFCRTKHGTDALARKLAREGVCVETIHGNRSQAQRERALAAFARRAVDALLATDVAARGIHIDDVQCVLHFDPPADERDYTHRSGRTARAGAHGTVVSFVTPDQQSTTRRMQKLLGLAPTCTEPDVTALTEATPTAPARTSPPDTLESGSEVAPTATPSAPRGTIKFFDTRRGFGFITRPDGDDLFVHHSALSVSGHRLRGGQLVEFDVGAGRKGEEARCVRLVAA